MVSETTLTQSTDPKVLEGPAVPFRAFRERFADGAEPCFVQEQLQRDGNDEIIGRVFEAGYATLAYGPPDTLTPTLIVDSSNGGSAVNWGPGEKTIWCAAPGELLALMDAVLTPGKQGRPLIVDPTSTRFRLGAPGFGQQASSELTIASGSVTPTGARHTIDTEGDASSDVLTHAATGNIPEGGVMTLSPENAGRVATVAHAAGGDGQFHLADGFGLALAGAATVTFERRGADWYEIARAATGAVKNLTVAQQLILSGAIEPAQVTADTDNYNPTGLALASAIKVATDAARAFTGLAGGVPGRVMEWRNAGLFPETLIHDATSTAANRFSLPGAANLTLLPGESATLRYDGTLSRWVVVSWNVATPDATTSVKGKAALLIASEIDTGTDTAKVATAAAIAGSKRTVKAWWSMVGSTGALATSFGISSSAKNSTGNYSVTQSVTAPAAYVGLAISQLNITSLVSKTTTVFTYKTGAGASYNAYDADSDGMIIY